MTFASEVWAHLSPNTSHKIAYPRNEVLRPGLLQQGLYKRLGVMQVSLSQFRIGAIKCVTAPHCEHVVPRCNDTKLRQCHVILVTQMMSVHCTSH